MVAAAGVGALDDVGILDLTGGAFVDPLVPDAVRRALLELVKYRPVRLGRRIQLHRDRHQPERQHPGPDRARHYFSPSFLASSSSPILERPGRSRRLAIS